MPKVSEKQMTILPKYCLLWIVVLVSCQHKEQAISENKEKLFTTVLAKASGLGFINELEETVESNYYQYLYTYIGGGVAAGDINNDGLIDLYFTSTNAKDRLYLNKGNLQFEEITQQAGILQKEGFNTGVSMADVNGDGWLDIYVSRGGGQDESQKLNNLLYVNNGDVTFSEQALARGLAGGNRTIQATFFDYDRVAKKTE